MYVLTELCFPEYANRYGYVTPDDASVLLEQHIGKRQIVDSLWRLVHSEKAAPIFTFPSSS